MKEKPKVLLIDDEPDKRLLLAFALENEGYEVHTAADGEAGLAAIEAHQPDLIVTDVMMPRMDGYEMIRRVRSNPQTKFIPVIIQSAARVEERDVRFGYELGAVGYITDPTNLDLLRAQARNALELKRHLDDLQAKVGMSPTSHSRDPQVDFTAKEAPEESIRGRTTVLKQEVLPQRQPTTKPKDPYRLIGTILSNKYKLIEYAGGGRHGSCLPGYERD